ncbi:beta-lactamase superfamily protein [Ceratobasidium sp. AG-Ba]|nr:beta-lactamase superfamily protein [Ceratobasidium sp. AG-Ba]
MSNAPTPTIEFIFHGTGTSSSVPNVACLTDDPITCETCGSTLTPQGQKNKRRNTGGILRIPHDGDRPERVIVIDVGKTFLSAALDLFPRYGLRRIDAVLLTHPHADAMNGLDDLRGWTLRGSIQDHIDIYVSAFTLREVQRSFPYLVAKEFATGGGDIPEFRWHIIKENEPFRVEGVEFDITPIAVHHGRLFTNDEAGPPGFTPTPNDTPGMSRNTTPSRSHLGLRLHGSAAHSRHSSVESLEVRNSPSSPSTNGQSLKISEPAPGHVSMLQPQPNSAKPKPYMCYGFVVGDFMGALATARRLGAKRTYMVGFGHGIPHSDWVSIGEALEGKVIGEQAKRPHVKKALEMVSPLKEGDGVWIRPAYDGLQVFADATKIWDAEQ